MAMLRKSVFLQTLAKGIPTFHGVVTLNMGLSWENTDSLVLLTPLTVLMCTPKGLSHS